MTGNQAPRPARPLPVAELARVLGVDRSTLWRALQADPSAPRPTETDDQGRPLYERESVAAWWPNRRRRGRPAVARTREVRNG